MFAIVHNIYRVQEDPSMFTQHYITRNPSQIMVDSTQRGTSQSKSSPSLPFFYFYVILMVFMWFHWFFIDDRASIHVTIKSQSQRKSGSKLNYLTIHTQSSMASKKQLGNGQVTYATQRISSNLIRIPARLSPHAYQNSVQTIRTHDLNRQPLSLPPKSQDHSNLTLTQ